MRIGVDYYPEHWEKTMWKDDVAAMQRAGVQVVRMGEFAWSRLEPEEGKFNFSWLEKIVTMFEEAGIEVILGTPTCTPPQWMFERYPEIIQVGKDGRHVPIGVRAHRCINQPVFREKTKKMVEALAAHFAGKKAVIGYQIDNELEANHCLCPVCEEKFRSFVKKKYKTVEKVNQAYGNEVWSGEYTSFSQVRMPFGDNQTWLNPSYMLDFKRYAAESTTDFIKFQAKLIRGVKKDLIITTNTCFCDNLPDFYSLFKKLDVVSYDNYPTTVIPEDQEILYSHAFNLDMMRGIKKKNFWVMEELSGAPGSWMPMRPMPKPGMIKGYSLQAVAHGADAVLHFRWRTAKSGAEMFWHGLIDHNNVTGRRFVEFCNLCATLKEADISEDMEIQNRVAILYSADSEAAFKIQPQVEGMEYMTQLKAYHDAFMAHGAGVDIIDVHSDFSGYKLIVAPGLFVTEESMREKVEEFVRSGGHFVLTSRSGVKDINNQCVMQVLPGIFSELAGAFVTEYDAIGPAKQKLRIKKESWVQGSKLCISAEDADTSYAREEISCTLWCDILEAETAEVLAVYGNQYYENAPAVTRNHFGQGEVYYIGTVLNRRGMVSLVGEMLRMAGVPHVAGLPLGIEYTVREKGEEKVQFLFNNTDKPKSFFMRHVNAFGMGDPIGIDLEPFEMKITKDEFL